MVQRQPANIERRRFLRLDTSACINFRRISDGNVFIRKNLTKDIAIAGIRFLSNEFIPVSAYIKVNLSFEKAAKPIEFICRVVWIKSLYNDESYEIGAQIWQIDKEDYKQIKNYIYK